MVQKQSGRKSVKKSAKQTQFDKMLKGIRHCVKQKISVDEKINIIIQEIVRELKVDVCSCYLVRPGDVLELYATKGLDEKAVHETFLRIGEGLIGEIALKRKPQLFENVWEHPSFVYKPETNEKKIQIIGRCADYV